VDAQLLNYEIDSSLAHVVMLKEKGWLNSGDAKKIITALRQVLDEGVPAEGYEDVHEYVESNVTKRTSQDVGGRLHTARSRNDQVATITRMACRDRLLELADKVGALVGTLLELSRRNSSAPMLAYTHTRQAQLQTLGHHLQSYAQPLLRDVDRILDCLDRTDQCPLGASAIAGSTIEVDRRRTSMLLGFASVLGNCEDAVGNRDYAVEAMFVQALLLVDLSRMAEDLIIYSSSEFSYFELPDELASPSSAMPHKKNADVLEMIRADAALGISRLVQMMVTLKGLPSGYSRDLQSVKAALIGSFEETMTAVEIMDKCFRGGSFDLGEMKRKAMQSDVYALPLAEWLVKNRGTAFREAHKVAGRVTMELVTRRLRFQDLSPKQLAAMVARANRRLKLQVGEAKNLHEHLKPRKVLADTTTEGGPSPAQVLVSYTLLKHELRALKEEAASRTKSIEQAQRRLKSTVDKAVL
jgi:argininosuccinate lyase